MTAKDANTSPNVISLQFNPSFLCILLHWTSVTYNTINYLFCIVDNMKLEDVTPENDHELLFI